MGKTSNRRLASMASSSFQRRGGSGRGEGVGRNEMTIVHCMTRCTGCIVHSPLSFFCSRPTIAKWDTGATTVAIVRLLPNMEISLFGHRVQIRWPNKPLSSPRFRSVVGESPRKQISLNETHLIKAQLFLDSTLEIFNHVNENRKIPRDPWRPRTSRRWRMTSPSTVPRKTRIKAKPEAKRRMETSSVSQHLT